mgnify:CR=1 FL=1
MPNLQTLQISEVPSKVGLSRLCLRYPLLVTCPPILVMTLKLTADDCKEQYQAADEAELQWDVADELDITWKYDARFAQGWRREVQLREGICLSIDQSQSIDRVIITNPDRECHYVHCSFLLSGNGQGLLAAAPNKTLWPYTGGAYCLYSTGLRDQLTNDYDVKPWSAIAFSIHKSVFRSFAASPTGELPPHLQHWVQPLSQGICRSFRDIQPTMMTVLQQILHCPYQGMVKRAYLEGKVIELMALVLDHESSFQRENTQLGKLKPDQIERIHYAKEILLQDMSNPPTLAELAHQAGLNDFLLKQGFRQIFGTTVFGELRSHRLKLAKQRLAEQTVSVAEVARQVGYGSGTAFARSFRREFGMSPKAYQKACR